MWLGLTWVQFAIDRQSGIYFFSLWVLLFFLKRFLLLLYSVIKKNQFIFSTFKFLTQKCSFSFTWNGLNERRGENFYSYVDRKENTKKSCDVNSLTQLFFEKAFNLSSIQVLQCNKESCLQCAFILCSMCMDIHFTQLTLGQAGVSQ